MQTDCSKPATAAPSHGILVLAAGASTRLGRPKQLESRAGESLLSSVLKTAISTGYGPIVTVLGANATQIIPVIDHLPVTISQNQDWETGMGSSLALGTRFFIDNFPELTSVIVLVCDQYRLKSEHIAHLVYTFERTKKDIVASAYNGTFGVPALFSKNKLQALAGLSGNEGAKKLIQRYPDDLAVVPFPEGVYDLDTEADVRIFLQMSLPAHEGPEALMLG